MKLNKVLDFSPAIVKGFCLSKSDSLILLIMGDGPRGALGVAGEISIVLNNIHNNQSTVLLNRISTAGRIGISEDCWMNDKSFVFSVGHVMDSTLPVKDHYLKAGVYLYNMVLQILKMISSGGRHFSPDGSHIEFIRNDKLKVLDSSNFSSFLDYKFDANFNVNRIHWSPWINGEILTVTWDKMKNRTVDKFLNIQEQLEIVPSIFWQSMLSWKGS